jgi:hypothetical protein
MVDILRLLPRFSWRGREYPLAARSVSFAHDSVPHRIEFRNGEFREQTGAHSFRLDYGIPMREGIATGPYVNLFNRDLPRLLKDFQLKDPGDLVDPIYGKLRCVPGEWVDESPPTKRDGTDLRLSFFHAPELGASDPELQSEIVSLQGVIGDAGALDREVRTINWEQEASPEPSTDIFGAVSGVASQITNQADRVASSLDDLAFRMEKTEAALDRLENPQNWRARDSSRRVRDGAVRVKRNYGDPTRKVKQVTSNVQKTISVAAAEAGMTVLQLLRLNPGLAKSPLIPIGTRLKLNG